jgi:hypothetical protein
MSADSGTADINTELVHKRTRWAADRTMIHSCSDICQ